MQIQVLVVSEIRFFREGLAHALGSHDAFEIQDALAPDAVVPSIGDRRPHVVLLHVSIPAGPRLARAIAGLTPKTRMIALGVEEEAEACIVTWAEAGIAGYIPPCSSLAQVAEAVRLVAHGDAACSPRAAAVLLRRIARLDPSQVPAGLTAREIEIARLIEDGMSNKEICRTLSISLPTVKNHVHNILGKLHVGRRSLIRIGSPSMDPK